MSEPAIDARALTRRFGDTVAVDALPGFARLFAYAPVSGAWNRCGVVVIGAWPPEG